MVRHEPRAWSACAFVTDTLKVPVHEVSHFADKPHVCLAACSMTFRKELTAWCCLTVTLLQRKLSAPAADYAIAP